MIKPGFTCTVDCRSVYGSAAAAGVIMMPNVEDIWCRDAVMW